MGSLKSEKNVTSLCIQPGHVIMCGAVYDVMTCGTVCDGRLCGQVWKV